MSNKTNPSDDLLKEQPFVSHLMELRDRLLRAVAVVAVVFLCLFPFANDIYVMVASPLMAHLPAGTSMIATEVASPFLTPFKLSLVAAIFLSMPFILYQFWAFIAPGLYQHEKRMAIPLVASSTILFYIGMLFAYYVVFPLVFAFLTSTAPEGVTVATDISRYLDFVLTLFFAFGIAFEMPIATIILVWMGITTPESLAHKRPYIIVGVFCIGMFLTPPDVISQTLLALPMWLLFELGLFFSRMFIRKREEAPAAGPGPGDGGRAAEASPAAASPAGGAGGAAPAAIAPVAGEPEVPEAGENIDPERFVPLTEEELERELDLIEEEEGGDLGESDSDGLYEEAINEKLRQVQVLRDAGDENGARRLLYDVIGEGSPDQVKVARNILEQLDAE